MANVDVLELQIRDNAEQTAKGLTTLANSLERIQNAVRGGLKLKSISNQITGLGNALENNVSETGVRRLERLARALERLNRLRGMRIPGVNQFNRLNQMGTSQQGGQLNIDPPQPVMNPNPAPTMPTRTIGHAAPSTGRWRQFFEQMRSGWAALSTRIHGTNRRLTSFFVNLQRVALYRGIDLMLQAMINGFSTGINNLYQYSKAMNTAFAPAMDQGASALQKMANSVATAVAPLIQSLVPDLQTVVSWIHSLCNALAQFFAMLNGASVWTKATDAATEYGEAVGAAGKAQKGMLAGFDEINLIQNQGGGGGGGAAGNFEDMFEETELSGIFKWMQQHLTLIKGLAYGVMAAFGGWKIAGLFTDSLKIVAGVSIAVLGLALSIWSSWDAICNGLNWDNLLGMLIGAVAMGGGLALAFGKIGAAIGFIVGGLVLAATSFRDTWVNGIDWENLIGLIAGVALATIGMGLAFGGVGAGIALLVGGLALIVLGVKEWIETGNASNETLTALSVGILAVGGAIALLGGGWIPLVIAAVAAAIVWIVGKWDEIVAWWEGTVVPWWNDLVSWFDTNICQPIGGFFSSVGEAVSAAFADPKGTIEAGWNAVKTFLKDDIAAPLSEEFDKLGPKIDAALGLDAGTTEAAWNSFSAWIATNVITPFRLTFSALGTEITAFLSDPVTYIREAWTGISTWFSENIANPISNVFIGMVNGIISALNTLIAGLNKISFSLPNWEWLGNMAGASFGINIQEIEALEYLPTGKVEGYASGGFPPEGQLFSPVKAVQQKWSVKWVVIRPLRITTRLSKVLPPASHRRMASRMLS